jgi:hypothetical protein
MDGVLVDHLHQGGSQRAAMPRSNSVERLHLGDRPIRQGELLEVPAKVILDGFDGAAG